jgi:hydroxyethylthiazole kinase-like uncharacterized protein yjeF
VSDAGRPEIVTTDLLRHWQLPGTGGGGKESRGSIVVVGGALDTPGAVLLAGLAALRVGAGRLTIATAEPAAAALSVAVPEAAVIGLPVTSDGSIDPGSAGTVLDALEGAEAVVLGPGMRGPRETREFVEQLLPSLIAAEATVVLDAMALTCGAVTAKTCADLRAVVATPNPTEASYLLDADADDIGDETPRELAHTLGAVVALRSRTASPEGKEWLDGSGTSGLGTSGSGDVLAGAIGGLAARGAPADQAAVWGVHLHAQSGERLAARIGPLGFLARELLDELPRVLAELSG